MRSPTNGKSSQSKRKCDVDLKLVITETLETYSTTYDVENGEENKRTSIEMQERERSLEYHERKSDYRHTPKQYHRIL